MKCDSVYWMCVACWMDWRKRNNRREWKCGDRMSAELKGCRIEGLVGILKTNTAIIGLLENISFLFMCAWGMVTCFHCQNSDMKISRSFPADKTHNTKIDSFFIMFTEKIWKIFLWLKEIPWKSEGITSLLQNDALVFLIWKNKLNSKILPVHKKLSLCVCFCMCSCLYVGLYVYRCEITK